MSVSVIALYLLLLKATVTSFAGMGSLPQIRQDFVVTHGVITDEQLSQSVVIGRSAPGPVGAYVVAIGYFAGGWPGAIAAWLAMTTPALLAIPLLTLLRQFLHLPRVRAAVDAVVIASAVLLLASVVQMAMDAFDQRTRVLGGRCTVRLKPDTTRARHYAGASREEPCSHTKLATLCSVSERCATLST